MRGPCVHLKGILHCGSMSALGQKQTYAVHNGMSALPPIATAKADIRNRSCLLCPRKRTCAAQRGMSALGQKRTSTNLFDHLVGAQQEPRNRDTKRLSGGKTDDENRNLIGCRDLLRKQRAP